MQGWELKDNALAILVLFLPAPLPRSTAQILLSILPLHIYSETVCVIILYTYQRQLSYYRVYQAKIEGTCSKLNPLEWQPRALASINLHKIPDVRLEVRQQRQASSGVSVKGDISVNNLDIRSANSGIVRRGDPILRADVNITHRQQGQLRDGVIGVGEAEVVALRRDILGQSRVSHARRGVCVQLSRWVALATEVSGSKGCDGSTQAVAHYDQLVVGVLCDGVLEFFDDVVTDELPGAPEAEFGEAPITETRVCVDECGISDPVAHRVGPAEGKHNCRVGVVDCNVAGGVCDSGAVRG